MNSKLYDKTIITDLIIVVQYQADDVFDNVISWLSVPQIFDVRLLGRSYDSVIDAPLIMVCQIDIFLLE